MAFPLPADLPRKQPAQDVSSTILTKIGSATYGSLDTATASKWLLELDETIITTKKTIHERISGSLPEFERQFKTAIEAQERLGSLKTNVDKLEVDVTQPETGLVDTLLKRLSDHSYLAQEASNAEALHLALHNVLDLRNQYSSLANLVSEGRLPAAVQSIHDLERKFNALPNHLLRAKVVKDLKSKLSATRARAEDQLDDAYSRAIVVSHSELVVRKDIQVRQSEQSISFSDIMSSVSPTSLDQKLGTLRRDIISLLAHVLTQPLTTPPPTSSLAEDKLLFVPAPPTPNDPSARLANLITTLDFLATHLFPNIPSSLNFPHTLTNSLTSNLLNNLLIPALPSSFALLPSYVSLMRDVVQFEENYVIKVLGNAPHDTPLREWINGVGGHYERQRRTEILGGARKDFLLVAAADKGDSFAAEIVLQPPEAEIIPVQEEDEAPISEKLEDDAWGLDDDGSHGQGGSDETEAWGFDDELEAQAVPKPLEHEGEKEPDPDDAWGWNDEDNEPPSSVGAQAEDDAWDDPWADPPHPEPSAPVPAATPAAAPKVAKRLERLAMKGRKSIDSAQSSPVVVTHPPSPPPPSVPTVQPPPEIKVRPPNLAPTVAKRGPIKESYRVSGKMKQVLGLVESILRDAGELRADGPKVLSSVSASTAAVPGAILTQTASSVLGLFRALRPVTSASNDIENGLQYSNDCFWLSEVLSEDTFTEEKKRMKEVAERAFDEHVDRQSLALRKGLEEDAQGFTGTTEQDRYDDCESAVNQSVQQIKRSASKWKSILPKSKYYSALGLITDAVLSHVLQDILALDDIPEVESNRLAELCRIFSSLEGLYVEDDGNMMEERPSFVVAYVPSWLKFSYLSELLEASMADITYLFESGALIDFETDELVRLVKGLFADNALRTTTINKIMAGHPGQEQQ